jgi:hypothetical protein
MALLLGMLGGMPKVPVTWFSIPAIRLVVEVGGRVGGRVGFEKGGKVIVGLRVAGG